MQLIFKIIRAFLIFALAAGLVVAGLLLHATYTNYTPPPTESLYTQGGANDTLTNELSFLIWNIGYAGLGKESDFFYDGGKMSIPTREMSQKNLQGVTQFLIQNKADFVLLQEVDIKSRRGYGVNQVEHIGKSLAPYNTTFATNYKVAFVPQPFTNPMGGVHGGLASYSRFKPSSSMRYQLPGSFEWPLSVYFLDRCLLVQRYPMSNGKELVVVNTHHSAYDGGKLKKHEMEFIQQLYQEEYDKKGNYVVVGGDWNQCPPHFQPDKFWKTGMNKPAQMTIEPDFLPQWLWVYDPKVATNREVTTPYSPDKSFTTVIDFYLISPNVELLEVKGVDVGFEYSDHQPVYMKVKLKS